MTTVKLYGPAQRSGVPLVLLAPFPLDARVWDGVRARLDRNVITVDPPGFGAAIASGVPTLDTYAKAVLAALTVAGVNRFVVAGNSMGGYAALAIAERAPERVAGLGLLGTKSTADSAAAYVNRLTTAERARRGVPASVLLAGMRTTVLSAGAVAERPDIVDTLNEWFADVRGLSVAWAQEAMAARPDRTAVLRQLKVPAVVMRGSLDTFATAADAQHMAEALGVDVITVPDRGHLIGVEAPDQTAAALTDLWTAAT